MIDKYKQLAKVLLILFLSFFIVIYAAKGVIVLSVMAGFSLFMASFFGILAAFLSVIAMAWVTFKRSF